MHHSRDPETNATPGAQGISHLQKRWPERESKVCADTGIALGSASTSLSPRPCFVTVTVPHWFLCQATRHQLDFYCTESASRLPGTPVAKPVEMLPIGEGRLFLIALDWLVLQSSVKTQIMASIRRRF